MSIVSGIGSLIKKELQNLLREKKSAFMIFFPIVIFLTVFIFATTKDVDNISIAVLNQDNGIHSKDFLEKVTNTKTFSKNIYVNNQDEMTKLINSEKAFIGIIIPSNFSKNLSLQQTSDIQIINDGRRTNSSMLAYGYLSQIIQNFQSSLCKTSTHCTPSISLRTWYNPNKEAIWFAITSIICLMIVTQTISLAGLSITREKEEGTLDQLLVSPIKPLGILIGKITPSIIIAMTMGLITTACGHFVYGVPMRGSILLLILSMFIFVTAVVGIGVFIASFSKTQQQAHLGTFILSMPMITLSGIMSPIESITNPFLKIFCKCNPIVYANKLITGIMLKDMSLKSASVHIYPLLLIGVVLLIVSSVIFAKQHRIKMF